MIILSQVSFDWTTLKAAIFHTTAQAASVAPADGFAAQLVEHGLLSLYAPVMRVAGYDPVMPLPKLESHYMPNQDRILAAAREVVRYQ